MKKDGKTDLFKKSVGATKEPMTCGYHFSLNLNLFCASLRLFAPFTQIIRQRATDIFPFDKNRAIVLAGIGQLGMPVGNSNSTYITFDILACKDSFKSFIFISLRHYQFVNMIPFVSSYCARQLL